MPRVIYWLSGGFIAIGAAAAGRFAGEAFPESRVTIWLAASGVMFLGLALLSLGSRIHAEEPDEDASDPDKPVGVDTPRDRRRRGHGGNGNGNESDGGEGDGDGGGNGGD